MKTHRQQRRVAGAGAACLALSGVLVLAACGGGDGGTGGSTTVAEGEVPAPEDVTGELTISVFDWQDPVEGQIIEAYEEARPNLDVRYEYVTASEYVQLMLQSQLAGDLPDVVATYDLANDMFADRGITQDISGFLDTDPELSRDEFAPTFLANYEVRGGEHDGEIHGLPRSADAKVVYYNKKLFDDAGLDYPADDWTWDDLLAAARELTVTEDGATVRYGFGANYSQPAEWVSKVQMFGGEVLADDGTLQLDSPEAMEAWHYWLDPIQEGIFTPPSVQATQGSPLTPFLNGTQAMYSGVRGQVPPIRDALGTDTSAWGVVTWPTTDGERVVGAGSAGIGISATTDNLAAAQDYLRWYYSEDGAMKQLAETYAVVPPVTSLQDSPIWRDLPAPPENNEAYLQAIEDGGSYPDIPFSDQDGLTDAVKTAMDDVLINGTSVEDAFTAANEQANATLSDD